MDIQVGLFDLLKLGVKLLNYKVQQYRLGTAETRDINTNYGIVRGYKRRTLYDDSEYYAFEGIPFAKPPLGELRFRAPQPLEPWEGVRDCTYCRSKPLQRHFIRKIIEGSEDCLFLNVYVKNLDLSKPLPVMVWIYGGGFQIGEASREIYSPDYFMREDVILITVNYRVGPFGFLSFSDPDLGVPGNAGLKDQLMALHWVQQNIAHFNGDPNNVTLFGESAGSASVHLLMITEKAKGLFHKAILQSGSAMCPWVVASDGHWGYKLATLLGYSGTNNDKEVFRYLSQLDGSKITKVLGKMLSRDDYLDHLLFVFLPVVEPYESDDCIIAKPFTELMRTTWSNDIPIILGGNSSEGLFSYQNAHLRPYVIDELGDCARAVPEDAKVHRSTEEIRQMGLTLKRAHFGDKAPNLTNSLFEYLDLLTYKYFWHGIHRTVRSRLTYAPQTPTYLYRFDFDSPDFNHYRNLVCGKNVRGTAHADDISYLFYHTMSYRLPRDSPEYKTIERMIGMWTAFARTSNPNCPPIKPAVWEPLHAYADGSPVNCLNINTQVEFKELPNTGKLRVWDSLYAEGTLF